MNKQSAFVLIALWLSFPLLAQKVDMRLFKEMQPRNIGPAGMSGRVTSIAVVERDQDILYVGTAAGGVWQSHNSGHTWVPIFDQEKAASIGDIAIYQRNPNIMYVGTGEGNPRNSQNSGRGMFKTLDGG
ncbi:MAG: xyloglucanase precursor, partial [Saprospiraceae bacterium]|nr:xyloglucanase precursor [Saprospiraceae bacterium]